MASDSRLTDSPMRAEWKCWRLVSIVASIAMPMEPPRLRVMLNRLEAEGVSPADNALASAWYRREIVGVHLRRLLAGQE